MALDAEAGRPAGASKVHVLKLAWRVLRVVKSRVAMWQSLRPKAVDFENICPSAVRRHLQLLMKSSELILPLDRNEYWLRHHGLRIPVRQRTHDSGRFFVRINRPGVGFVFVL